MSALVLRSTNLLFPTFRLPDLLPDYLLHESRSADELLGHAAEINPYEIYDDLAAAFPTAFVWLEQCGVHPRKKIDLYNPFTSAWDAEDYRNVGEHCLATAYCAQKLGLALQAVGAFSDEDVAVVTERALLHGLGKRFEKMYRDYRGRRTHFAKETPEDVEACGVTREFATVICSYGSETGGEAVLRFFGMSADGRVGVMRGKLREKVVRIADELTFSSPSRAGAPSRSYVLPLSERAVVGDFRNRYPTIFTRYVALDEHELRFVIVPNSKSTSRYRVLGTVFEACLFVMHGISTEVQKLLVPEWRGNPEELLIRMITGSDYVTISSEPSVH